MAKKREHSEFWDAAYRNDLAFSMYVERLTNIALSMFEWSGLPDSIELDYLEKTLFFNGSILWFEDEVLGLLSLSSTLEQPFNVYELPTRFTVNCVNGYYRKLDTSDAVVMYNDMCHSNTYHGVLYFADRLWNCDRTIDVNIAHQKTPYIITCSENQKLSIKNLFMKYEGNEPIIYGTKQLDLKDLTTLPTLAPFVADKVHDTRDRIWNDAMSFLGIPNTGMQKRERVNIEEISMGNGAVMGHRYSRLQARKEACKKINKMFGTNIDCNYRDFTVPSADGEGDQIE